MSSRSLNITNSTQKKEVQRKNRYLPTKNHHSGSLCRIAVLYVFCAIKKTTPLSTVISNINSQFFSLQCCCCHTCTTNKRLEMVEQKLRSTETFDQLTKTFALYPITQKERIDDLLRLDSVRLLCCFLLCSTSCNKQ